MELLSKIPAWIRNGTLSSLLVAILVLAFEAIFELKVQDTYEKTVEPFLLTPVQISFTTNRLHVALFIFLVVALVFLAFVLIERQIKRTVGKKWIAVANFEPPMEQEQFELNSTNVTTEIVQARKKRLALNNWPKPS